MAESYRHDKSQRAYIPSKEEAGYEKDSPAVQEQKQRYDAPKNPVVHRGQDPELFWMHKYGEDDTDDRLSVDIRSLYRHEHIAPEKLMESLYRVVEEDDQQPDLFSVNELFGNSLEKDELEKVSEYYQHSDGWSNRLIQGDSLSVMTSLLEREGMAGQVQTIYIDPPYGIKYGSNWQMKLNDRTVKDGKDEHVTGEPEMIKAYRDTWELGIHSYLSYMRDRLLVAKELLKESGSCFVQISDENVHLVRCLMDEVFGSENFVNLITFSKTSNQPSNLLPGVADYILWYAKSIDEIKYRQLFYEKQYDGMGGGAYNRIEFPDGETMTLNQALKSGRSLDDGKIYRLSDLRSPKPPGDFPVEYKGKTYTPKNGYWKTGQEGFEKLIKLNRIELSGNNLNYKRYIDDFPAFPINNLWHDTGSTIGAEKSYVVQTGLKIIERCVLMSSDPGDLILDPTCGSGTTAYTAEQWGRRWITIDTSRIALNIAKTRLMTATFPYYYLHGETEVQRGEAKDGEIKKKISYKPESQQEQDIRQGFVYKEVPHITLKQLANDEPPESETLYDQPYEDKKKIRVTGPFTVETQQNFEPVRPEELSGQNEEEEDGTGFEEKVFDHLKTAGVKNGIRNEQAVFTRIDRLGHHFLHAEGFYQTENGESKAYMHIGPKFGTVSKEAVNQAVKACRQRGDADWLIILGFSFESDIENMEASTSMGSFIVTKVRMHDDLLQEGLLKKDKKAASFVTIGEPDVRLHRENGEATISIEGLDMYDPIKDQVKSRDVQDIAYWMVDTDYDGSNFVVRQVFFCGGSKDEFKQWEKGLSKLAQQSQKRNAERTLKIEIDDEAFDRLYGHSSHPIKIKRDDQKIAVRVISQYGEESMKVVGV